MMVCLPNSPYPWDVHALGRWFCVNQHRYYQLKSAEAGKYHQFLMAAFEVSTHAKHPAIIHPRCCRDGITHPPIDQHTITTTTKQQTEDGFPVDALPGAECSCCLKPNQQKPFTLKADRNEALPRVFGPQEYTRPNIRA